MSFEPFAYPISQRAALMPKLGIEAAYRTIRDRLRRYSGTSIANLALRMLWHPPKGTLGELGAAPWLTLLLVKWAIQDSFVHLRVGPDIPVVEFELLRQELWDLAGVSHADRTNIQLMFRNLVHVQLEFQRHASWGFLRWPALYAELDHGSRNRRQFREVMGLEPDAFLDLVYALHAPVVSRKMPMDSDYLGPLRATYGNDVDQVYGLFVRDLPGLRHELQSNDAQRIRGKQELFEFPYLQRFPFLRLRNGSICCWHPLVLARGMEDAVHLRLSTLGQDYANEFSRVFEKYVTSLAADCGMPMLSEAAYKAQMGGHLPAVEVIFEGEDCNIFVEAKMSLFADDVVLQDSESVVYQKTKRVRDAVKQGWRVGALIRDPAMGWGARFKTRQDYLLIVTSRELNLGNGEKLQKLYTKGEMIYPDIEAEKRLPLSNIFILSIEDFERTMGSVQAGEINLSNILKEAVLANKSGDTARTFFSDFIGRYTQGWTTPISVGKARSAAEDRLAVALGRSPGALAKE